MHLELIESLRAAGDLAARERLLRHTLRITPLSEAELEALKSDPFIQRHLALLSVIQTHQSNSEFQIAQARSENESMSQKLLWGLVAGAAPPPPGAFQQQVTIARPLRVVLGLLLLAAALLFWLATVVALSLDRTQIPSPGGINALAGFSAALALSFTFVGARLLLMETTDRLFTPRATKIAAAFVLTLGILTAISSIYIGPPSAIFGGILCICLGVWLYRSSKKRK